MTKNKNVRKEIKIRALPSRWLKQPLWAHFFATMIQYTTESEKRTKSVKKHRFYPYVRIIDNKTPQYKYDTSMPYLYCLF